MTSLLRLIEKLLCLAYVLPPVYFLFRFIKWYLKQARANDEREI